MKFLRRLWEKITLLEKISVLVTLVFTLFTVAVFRGWSLNGWFQNLTCPLCRRELEHGEYYLFDARSGDALELSRYLSGDHAVFWFGGTYSSPQELYPSRRCGYARFPESIPEPVSYCRNHRGLFVGPEDFYILSETEYFTICYAIPDEGTTAPGGQTILKQYNESLHSWELVIQW